jgi:3'(2'), 5'-bisphosphate nucleotidase
MSEPYQHERKVAVAAVRDAARVCRSVQAAIAPDVLKKEDRSLVTVADFGSQAIICRALAEAFPDDPIIGEEDASALSKPDNQHFLDRVRAEIQQTGLEATGEEICRWIDRGSAKQYAERFWTLDPIDGTKGFLRGGQYAISLAIVVGGQIDVAVLACPNLRVQPERVDLLGVIFYAVRGRGSWMIPLDGEATETPLRVSEVDETSAARFCESVESGHSSHVLSAAVANQLEITREPLRLDSQAKYAVVARGEAQIYMRLPVRADYTEKIWDHAGGVLIVEEAGGTVTDVRGIPLDFTHGSELVANRGVLATNRFLHERVLEALRKNLE